MDLKNIIFNHLELKISNQYAMKVAKRILDDILIIRVGHVPDNIELSPDYLIFNNNFNWHIDIGEKTNMAMFHLNTLEPIKYLLQAYEIDNNDKYLYKAIEILEAWNNNLIEDKESTYTWYDHCVSERTLIIILLKINLNNRNINDYNTFIHTLLSKHQLYLADSDNHSLGNHGLMIDRSLYILTKYLNNNDSYVLLAKKRIRRLFDISFTKNGINTENSISYHLFNMDLYLIIEYELLNYFEDSIGEDFKKRIEAAFNYIAIFTQNNTKFPNIGDGERYDLKQLYSRRMGETYQSYIPKMLKRNEEQKNFYFPDEGIFYYKQDKRFFSFISGKLYNNHKHGDDLSFTYSFDEDDILVDCGTYTYQKGEFRKHFMSARSHNGLIVENKSYPFLSKELSKIGLIHFEENNEYTYVVGKNDLYESVNINRHIIITKLNSIIIYDELISDFSQLVTQNFNLHPDFNESISFESDNLYKVTHPMSKRELVIKQHQPTNIQCKIGDIEKADYGIYSERFHKISPIKNVQFDTHENIFLTSIQYGRNNSEITVQKNDNHISIIEENLSLVIKLYQNSRELNKLSFIKEKKIDGKRFSFECIHNYNFENPQYAWYIYKDGKIFDKKWYSESNILNYKFVENGKYRIQYYILDKLSNEKIIKWHNGIYI